MHGAIAAFLRKSRTSRCARPPLDERSTVLTESVLDQTDVLVWWGHMAHGDVQDEIVERAKKRVWRMGLVVLHSGHYAEAL